MKNNLNLLLVLLSLTLSSCGSFTPSNHDESSLDSNTSSTSGSSSSSSSSEETYDDGSIVNPRSIQDTTILHAWNWKLNKISEELDNIKNAGFNTIQISPMQPQKDYYQNQNYKSQWWKLYQPYGFSIAQDNQNVMGTKNDLKNLCSKAKNKGIDIIVDVVANHLAGDDLTKWSSAVQTFESEIYNNNLNHNSYSQYADNKSIQNVVWGNIIKAPDLKTEDTRVQSRVLSLLKEYIDCGISGFRFDAAKHIETKDDGEYASNFWDYVLGNATEYKVSKDGVAPYYYGEILDTCGPNRKFSSYTSMMSITDSKQGERIRNAVKNKSLSSLTRATYETNVSPNKLVLWAESHDNFATDSNATSSISSEIMNIAYVIQASRKDASSLYFARPNNNTIFGDTGSLDYKSSLISAINKFHLRYNAKEENIYSSNGAFINVRGGSIYKGAVIVPISSNLTSVSLEGFGSGEYLDLVTNKKYQVASGVLTASVNVGSALILVPNGDIAPTGVSLTLTPKEEVFKDTTSIKVDTDADIVKYSINNNSEQTLVRDVIELSSSLSNGVINVKVTASKGSASVTKVVKLIKTTSLIDKDLIVYDIDASYSYFAWIWSNDKDGRFVPFITEGAVMGCDLEGLSNYIIVKLPLGIKTPSWDSKIAQTEDLVYISRVNSFSDYSFK